ncbi:DUF3422 family protein [Acinetobacter baumannii]
MALIKYLTGGFDALGWHVNHDLLVAVATPLVFAMVFAFMHRARRKLGDHAA